jgi:hypothetical protein
MCFTKAYQQVAVRDKDHSLGAAEMRIDSVLAVVLSATLVSTA